MSKILEDVNNLIEETIGGFFKKQYGAGIDALGKGADKIKGLIANKGTIGEFVRKRMGGYNPPGTELYRTQMATIDTAKKAKDAAKDAITKATSAYRDSKNSRVKKNADAQTIADFRRERIAAMRDTQATIRNSKAEHTRSKRKLKTAETEFLNSNREVSKNVGYATGGLATAGLLGYGLLRNKEESPAAKVVLPAAKAIETSNKNRNLLIGAGLATGGLGAYGMHKYNQKKSETQ